ncbi:adenosylhomocysteinase [Candidatus Bathyarchaeota archaeon]|jgi:adenosylhomocysteinase|nr:adenosylhomocysteinase [Candidatus Bathyarchaeota archaeon]
MTQFKVKDVSLTKQGLLLIEWAESRMPVLTKIRRDFENRKPLEGFQIAACLHVTKETAVLMRTLLAGGAKVALCGSNPLSTQDEVTAALVNDGVNVYAWRGETTEEYYWCVEKVIDYAPFITLDDGADLVSTIHRKKGEALNRVKGGTEETTTGVMRLREMAKAKALKYPIIAVNDAYTKYLFDNRYGTGQSTIDGIVRATNVLLAGKNFVVCGYGWCGRGLALRARGMGANVIITEVDPIKALEAIMDGFRVMPMNNASKIGDIFVTVTGNINVIQKEHMLQMKNGTILANSGHFNVEINISDLENISSSNRVIKSGLEEFVLRDERKLYLLTEGRLVNLAAAEGHPSEVMDMSFANQALCVEYLVKEKEMKPKVYSVPEEIDRFVANLKLKAMDIEIDDLTEAQKRYLTTWEEGTV